MNSILEPSDVTVLVSILGLLGAAGGSILIAGVRHGLSSRLGKAASALGCFLLGSAVLGALGILLLLFVVPKPSPSFQAQLLHYPQSDDAARDYEVTNMQVWAEGVWTDYSMDTGVIVRSAHVPTDFGPVEIMVLAADGAPILHQPRTWIPAVEGQEVTVTVPLADLIAKSGLKVNPDRYGGNIFDRPWELNYEASDFVVQITKSGTDELLDAETFALVNTPYYHTTTVSGLYPARGGSVTAYVAVHNLGARGTFNLVCNLFRVDSSVRFQPDWGIGNAWERVARDDTVVRDGVPKEGGFTAECTLPGPNDTFLFDEPGFFALETYVVKQQPYAYPAGDGAFFECEQKWLFADPSDVFLLIIK